VSLTVDVELEANIASAVAARREVIAELDYAKLLK
jgi:hypothetical protein